MEGRRRLGRSAWARRQWLLDAGHLFGEGLLFDTGLFLGSGDLLRDLESRLVRDRCLRPRRGVRESSLTSEIGHVLNDICQLLNSSSELL